MTPPSAPPAMNPDAMITPRSRMSRPLSPLASERLFT